MPENRKGEGTPATPAAACPGLMVDPACPLETGEIACGYGDGCFTREQCVLVAYHRGRMCPEHGVSGGLMAAVGLGAGDAEARLAKFGAPSCVVGCDNSPVSTTLSGARAGWQ